MGNGIDGMTVVVSKLPRTIVNWMLASMLLGTGALIYAGLQYQVSLNQLVDTRLDKTQSDLDKTGSALDSLVGVMGQQNEMLAEYRRDVKDLQKEQLETQKRMERILARIESRQVSP